MSFLKITDLYKSYGSVSVLKDINIEIDEGGFLVLVGPSGCGKSTLLNTIAGLEPITSGDIAINGKSVSNLHPSQRDIAMVFQSYALYPNMTVAGNIAFGMEIRKVPKPERDKAIQQVADMLQIGHLLDRKPSQLSGGQRRRVAMGRALVRNPQVFLFDEPLSNLDAKLRVDMRTEIKRLHSRMKTTIVYVTHDQIEALTDPDGADRNAASIVEGDCLIDVVEPAGSDTFAVTRLGGKHVVARLRADARIRAGQSARLAFNLDKSVFFDSASQTRIL
ncbi:sugar ABC transporter ATP-binding protein [Brucella melitensis]|uniref:ABC transporter ATP-binding protein n=1 Tax=Brucella melitensis TaxID=29459 RepID=UPI00048DD521|nr:ABC transporter ATP-binding protein [Brucella melitensis]ARY00947.1 sugar ABC transporter ATP-binding protein [Brucella melitensis]ARZ24522.1 sugar ABC transporter ATP-binding protein [Brucella melitensis]MBT2252209.1 ABC transporter ATP-binding protein [Brucella abortus]